MPGYSLSDFEIGQWVGMSDEKWDQMGKYPDRKRIGKVVGFKSGEFVKVKGYKAYDLNEEGGFYPSSLLTAEETEEQLYCCSYCGKEGHNRRTCPEVNEAMEVGMKKEYVRNGREASELCKGDLFMVEYTANRAEYREFAQMVYEYIEPYEDSSGTGARSVIVDNIQKGHTFRAQCNFDKRWTLIPVSEVGASTFKELHVWELVELVLPKSRLTLLYGPPGTGKTTAGNFLGEPKEVYNLTLTEETPAAELRGHFIPKGQEFVWMDGPALTAFKRGGRLVLNEIDKASGDALTFCHALLDDPGIAAITLPYKDEEGNPVTVKPHPDFHVVATMNGEPEDLPDALRDRFAVRIHVNKVHPNAIKSLPKELRKIATKGVSSDGERSISIRGWNAFVALREHIGEDNAATAVFGPRAKTILNTIKIDSISKK
jgi:hypothetical protein